MGGFGAVGMILFWVLAVLAIVWLLRSLDVLPPPSRRGAGPDTEEPRRDAALETLRERYARGEVDEDEFDRRRRELMR